ncbi:hypothetical protein QYM36_005746 [Artemia franciscana]|uniref:Reverse transcriptase domain-containing protein n=1 Tax=Artemia franciscana TaxID=6661 RepID=A0AA88LA22_ARTSF|nr:hypothetical protein QYM36_005746 [Artemia franciscana]
MSTKKMNKIEFVKHLYTKVLKFVKFEDDSEIIKELKAIARTDVAKKIRRNYFFVSVNDVLRAVRQLKVNKAPGLDGVSSNHLRNGSPLLIQHMQLFFQMCIDSATVPKSFCTGVVTNIPKKYIEQGAGKIAPLRTYIEVCVWVTSLGFEFGFRKHLSCAFAHRLLKRILAKADSLELSVHICSVDISSAFDSVIQSSVFRTLLDAGVNAHIAAMLSFWCSNSYIRVKLRLEKLNELVKLKRGLRQGSVLSLILLNTLTSKVK